MKITKTTPAAPVGDDDSHYTTGRRWSHIYNAWVLAESWNDKEEIAGQAARITELEQELKELKDFKHLKWTNRFLNL